MSSFITKADFASTIETDELDDLTAGDDSLIDIVEEEAIELIQSYLNVRFDVVNTFNKSGTDRHHYIVKITKDISLYFLYERTSTDQIPEFRKVAYDAALKWLDKVANRKVDPVGLPKLTDAEGEDLRPNILFTSNPKRSNHI